MQVRVAAYNLRLAAYSATVITKLLSSARLKLVELQVGSVKKWSRVEFRNWSLVGY